ncbi:MAG: hypothetical protein OXE84_06890 [Rhodobacteraceae bacterium]|nr:hypothetical protein [Paracoccaceae bacterium]
MSEDSADVGLDVHMDSLAVAIGPAGPEWPGTIAHSRPARLRLIKRLSPDGLALSV